MAWAAALVLQPTAVLQHQVVLSVRQTATTAVLLSETVQATTLAADLEAVLTATEVLETVRQAETVPPLEEATVLAAEVLEAVALVAEVSEEAVRVATVSEVAAALEVALEVGTVTSAVEDKILFNGEDPNLTVFHSHDFIHLLVEQHRLYSFIDDTMTYGEDRLVWKSLTHPS